MNDHQHSNQCHFPPEGRFPKEMNRSDFYFRLPSELVAQAPASRRDSSRLFMLHRQTGVFQHRQFPELLEFLLPGDLLILNNSKVIPARLRGVKAGPGGGKVEILLAEELSRNEWKVMLRPAKRVRPGTRLLFYRNSGEPGGLAAEVAGKDQEGLCRLKFETQGEALFELLGDYGEVPLPPYIERSPHSRSDLDRERYQTVYAKVAGSVAAPTAGLHFTEELLSSIRNVGVQVEYVTLHVGLGTFAPVKAQKLADHPMHEERFHLGKETARAIEACRRRGNRVVAVGTTTLRVLESIAAGNEGRLEAGSGRTALFIYPPHDFRVVDAMVTNFHLPESTLLMLVSAFAAPGQVFGRSLILSAYEEAIRCRYRFFSYGDAMLIV
jgi:S-adenosylmethionine:tRNA ribosyltransferase-isomerase